MSQIHAVKMKYSQEELQQAWQELRSKQSMLSGTMAALIMCLPCLLMYAFLSTIMQLALLWLLLLPPLLVGLAARYAGRLFSLSARLPTAVIAGALHCSAVWLFFGWGLLIVLLAPVAAGAALAVSKIRLNRLQQHAVIRAEMGAFEQSKAE